MTDSHISNNDRDSEYYQEERESNVNILRINSLQLIMLICYSFEESSIKVIQELNGTEI